MQIWLHRGFVLLKTGRFEIRCFHDGKSGWAAQNCNVFPILFFFLLATYISMYLFPPLLEEKRRKKKKNRSNFSPPESRTYPTLSARLSKEQAARRYQKGPRLDSKVKSALNESKEMRTAIKQTRSQPSSRHIMKKKKRPRTTKGRVVVVARWAFVKCKWPPSSSVLPSNDISLCIRKTTSPPPSPWMKTI